MVKSYGKENNDDYSSDAFYKSAAVTVAVGKKVGNGNGINLEGVLVQTLCNNQPVEISAQRKAYYRPCGVSQTAEICKTGDTHQKPAAHVGGFGAHCNHNRAELAAAEVKVLRTVVALGVYCTYGKHAHQINDY